MISPRTLLGAGAAAAALALAGCGSASPAASQGSTSGPDAGPADSYLATGSGWVDYIQWDSTGSGTLTADTLTGTAPQEQVSSSQSPISVTINGGSVDISGLGSARYGTLSGGRLTLQVLQSNGTLGTDTFTAAGQNAFNADVQTLQQQAQSDNSAAVQQAASASSASAAADRESQAQADLSALTQDTSFSGDVSQVGSDVKQTAQDLAQTRSDAANGNGDQCNNANTTVYNDAATTVYNDVLTTVLNDKDRVGNDIATLRDAISTVQQDQRALSSAGLPGTSGADAAVSAAQHAIASAIAVVNADIDHANGDLDAAYQVADSVGTGSCAGGGPGQPPSGVSHLS